MKAIFASSPSTIGVELALVVADLLGAGGDRHLAGGQLLARRRMTSRTMPLPSRAKIEAILVSRRKSATSTTAGWCGSSG